MAIYTKTGDTGETSLLGGIRVRKDSLHISAIGEVDELNSHLGVLVAELSSHTWEKERTHLLSIQHHLFNVGGMIAAGQTEIVRVPSITPLHVTELETWIDTMTAAVPPLTQFILPGGSPTAALAHHARAVCRRAERSLIALHAQVSVDPILIQFLNRLSDVLFTLGRYINTTEGRPEVYWKKTS